MLKQLHAKTRYLLTFCLVGLFFLISACSNGNNSNSSSSGASSFMIGGSTSQISQLSSGNNLQNLQIPLINYSATVYGGGSYVMVGTQGVILNSTDSVHWKAQTSGTSTSLRSVTYGGGKFVVVGDEGTILTSSTGVVWTPVASGVHNSFIGINYL